MRLRRATAPLGVATLVVAATLAWLVVSRLGADGGGGAWAVPGESRPSIEQVEGLAATISDRPLPSSRSARDGPQRIVPSLIDGPSASPRLPSVLAGDGSFPASPFTTAPLAFGLARRGPPVSASR